MIVFASRTGNVRYIVRKLDKSIPTMEVIEGAEQFISEPYLIFTYTDGLGEVPERVSKFLDIGDNAKYLKGVIASGNTNFGHNVFCFSADVISEKYNVPIINKIELRGYDKDIKIIEEAYEKIIKNVGEDD